MRINREELLLKLQQVSPGLAAREIIEQSASYVFSGNKIITFNDEIFCQVGYNHDINGAVHAQPLLDLLNKLVDEELDIEVTEEEFKIKGKRSRSGIRMENEILLPIEDIDEPAEWKELDAEFTDAIEIVQSCASRDDSNFNLTCIHIHPEYLEACDNFQLTRYPLKTGLSKSHLVRKEAVKHISGHGMSEIAETKSWIHFRSPSGLTLSCRQWEEEYTDLSGFLDFTGEKTTLPGGLSESIERAEIFSSDNMEDNQVIIELRKGKLRLRGEGAHGWHEERKKVEFNGDDLSFMISPKLLSEITKRTNKCEIAPGRLKIDAGKFVFVACLGEV